MHGGGALASSGELQIECVLYYVVLVFSLSTIFFKYICHFMLTILSPVHPPFCFPCFLFSVNPLRAESPAFDPSCVSQLFVAVTKKPGTNNLEEERFILAHDFQIVAG